LKKIQGKKKSAIEVLEKEKAAKGCKNFEDFVFKMILVDAKEQEMDPNKSTILNTFNKTDEDEDVPILY
jgi:hypothetical protein